MSYPFKLLTHRLTTQRSFRRRVVRIARLPLAAAVALGFGMSWTLTQSTGVTLIKPLTGQAATQAVLGNSQPGI
jgi:hypothetical protein